jgi:hypothetical protein
MTYQRDPERTPANDDIVRRENIANRDAEIARRNAAATSSGVVPILIAILVLLGIGYFAYSYLGPHAANGPRTTEVNPPRTTPTPAPSTTPPASPQTK